MKTLTTLFALTLTALTTITAMAIDANWPGWNCEDTAKLDQAIASITNKEDKLAAKVLKQMVVDKVSSYEELCRSIDTVVDGETDLDATQKAQRKVTLKKQVPLCKELYLQEAWEYCKKNPSYYDMYFYLRHGKQFGLSDTEVYHGILNTLLQYQANASAVQSGVSKLIDLGIKVDVTTQKEDLQKLNRKYSRQLLVNKAQWEPVIALIRTAIDTY